MRTTAWAITLLAALILASACGGQGEARPDPLGAQASCEGIDALDSYRYSIIVKLKAPAFQSTPATSPEPLGEFADTLSALLSDFEIRGAHVAPDRTQAILQFKEDEIELRAIGDRRWERFGNAWEQQATPAPDIGFLTPGVICNDIVADVSPGLVRTEGSDETVNGVRARRYTLDKAGLSHLPNLLGAGPETDLPQEFQVALWLAEDGNWPVKMDIAAEDTDEQGNPLSLKLYMELRDVNDAGITIEEPVVASPAG